MNCYMNFSKEELSCRGVDCCGNIDGTTQELRNTLEVIRYLGGDEAVYSSSAYRCPKHNNKVGSKHTSFHVKGLAIDVTSIGKYKADTKEGAEYIQAILEKAGMWTYIGKGFVHGDLRDRQKR